MITSALEVINSSSTFSYSLSREYRVVWDQYLRLLLTSEDRIGANLCVQEQSTNMTSQCQYPLRPRDVTDQLCKRQNAKSEKTVLGDNGEISDL